MTDVLTLLQEVLPHYRALAAAAEKCHLDLDQDVYDSIGQYLDFRQSLLDNEIIPRMSQIALDKREPFDLDDRIKEVIRQILEKDRYCMEKMEAKRKALQSVIHELQCGVKAVRGYGSPPTRSPLWVKEEA